MNTWPGGYRHSINQDEHEKWNSTHYPGTRQLCCLCEEPTGRCEEDSIYLVGVTDPIGEYCYAKHNRG